VQSYVSGSQEAHPDARAGAQAALGLDAQLRGHRKAHAEGLLAGTEAAPSTSVVEEVVEAITFHLNRLVYNSKQTQRIPGTIVRREGQVPSPDSSVNECYDGFGATFNFYKDILKRNSIDDAGLNLLGSVHYGVRYNNAFWNGRQMVFGDGDGHIFNHFTSSVDVIGHELTHGVTSYTCNLMYQGQSGALNESISDVFGSMVKQYSLNQKAEDADWLIGEGLFSKAIKGVALRSMKAPGTAYNDPMAGKDPQPADMSHYVQTEDDEGGVHINSGIPNRAFYLAAVGLGGYSWEKAGKVWYATMNDERLSQDADFTAFADLTVDNAIKLFGASTGEAISSAWTEVGVKLSK
jgi:Zn-dependent metalloprotease